MGDDLLACTESHKGALLRCNCGFVFSFSQPNLAEVSYPVTLACTSLLLRINLLFGLVAFFKRHCIYTLVHIYACLYPSRLGKSCLPLTGRDLCIIAAQMPFVNA